MPRGCEKKVKQTALKENNIMLLFYFQFYVSLHKVNLHKVLFFILVAKKFANASGSICRMTWIGCDVDEDTTGMLKRYKLEDTNWNVYF